MVPRITGIIITAFLWMASAAAQVPEQPDLSTIVARMATAQQQNAAESQARSFTVKRDYQLLDKSMESKAQIVAQITYVPPNQKQYQIESSHGGMGEKILRDILDHETEVKKDPQRKELSQENYKFQLLGTEMLDGNRCYVLGLDPKRDDKELIKGRAWIDAQTFKIRRLEGSPSKNPSWWVHDVQILMTFAEVDGMWLRTFTHAVANVRFKGRYEMVSRDLEYRPVEQVATRRRNRSAVLAGAAFNP